MNDLKEIYLEKIKLYFERKISAENLLNDAKCKIYKEKISQDFIISIKDYLLGERLFPNIIKYPLNWWEAFKERWFNKFLLKKYPIKYKTIEINATILYPKLKVKLPQEEHFIAFQIYD